MTASLKIIEPGLHTTIQDLGRPGFQFAGIPVSGVLDRDSLAIANALVGNRPGEAAMEVRYAGPTIAVHADRVLVAVAGTTGTLDIESGGTVITAPAYRSIALGRGTRLRLRSLPDSATACLAVAGGFDLRPIMGSLSTYVRGGFGGYRGRALAAGDDIPLRGTDAEFRELALSKPFDLAPRTSIRAVAGPQADFFTDAARALFESTEWRVGAKADRMGIRLDGPILAHSKGHDIVSDGIVTGAVQVPGNGLPIVLLADRQTTGGYPKIATVVSADLGALGRARSGHSFRFRLVSLDEAAEARRAHVKGLKRSLSAIGAPDERGVDLEKLYAENLISGVYDDE